jgi:hypothetical protein
MADQFTLQSSLEEQSSDFLSQNKQYVYITDSNSGSYNGGQVTMEMSSIANSGKYFIANESYISIPLVTTLYAIDGNFKNDTPENNFAVSLKNGFTSIISSIQVEVTNNSVVSVMNYSNVMLNVNQLTEQCLDTQNNYGSSIGFHKDDVLGTTYESEPSPRGLGECNNTIKASLFDPSLGYGKSDFSENKGRLQRMKTSSYDPLLSGESMNSLATTGKSYGMRDGLAAGKIVNFYSVAHLPLNLLSDFFAKLPLVKGAFIKIQLNLNCNTKTTMEIDATGNFTSVNSSSQFSQVPYMISPIEGDLSRNSTTPVTKMELSIGVARNNINASGVTYGHPTLSSVRVYAALYDLTWVCFNT